ncbi:uncharacterized protein N7484_000700 [Penicillium longicatenatum]|uniref:uncharacterized protein n=1 Tax=Penicillium longicatenatum TaxID=1561947 RepID=UPI002546C233|nr:uncharacterized protein N7484_000700 [Penicillium longicatenatum]KAJ5661328.1 hypothetical protein N7484_000700 [Penicillium longicatenatum]
MLKPFQIKDQQVSPPSKPVEPSGIREVQISASDYDNIASNHPRARLTYLDDDDGDQITVGSSLELAQRLDEPLEIWSRHEPTQLPQDEPEPMHIFDIRRSKSVTELWKRFENQSSPDHKIPETKNDAPMMAEPTAGTSASEKPTLNHHSATTAPGDDSRPLLAAFEAELANILGSTEEPAERAPQAEPSPAPEPSTNTNSQRMPQGAEALAAQILHHLTNGANMVQSELRTRLPELQRQVRDAQRHLPENIGASLQALLTTLEVHVRAAFNNIPDNGRQWAEEAIHAGRPVAENAAEGFRMMASEFNEVGRTLFAAFEHEFGRAAPRGMNDPSDGSNTPPTSAANGVSNAPSASINSQATEPHAADSKSEEKSSMGYDLASMAELATSSQATTSDARTAGAYQPFYPQPPSSFHRYGLDSVPNLQYSLPRTGGYTSTFYPPPYYPSFVPHHMPQPRSVDHHAHPPPPPPKTQHSDLGAISPWLAGVNGIPPISSSTHRPGPLPVPSLDHHLKMGDTQTAEPGNKTLFIGNVGFNVTERTIQDVFASKGFLVTVDLPLDAVSGKHAGFGYLHFPSIHPAMAAMDALQGTHIDGHAINLEFSDAMPIQGLVYAPNQHPSQHKSGSKTPGSEVEQKQSKSIKRRKSVSFQVSNQSANEPIGSQSQNADKTALQSAEAAASSPLIDLSIDESACAPRAQQPSIMKGHWQQGKSKDEHDISFDLNPESEMSRFPPVSQLEAQHLATQHQRHAPGPVPITLTANNNDSIPTFTGDLPHRSRTTRGNHDHAGPGLRRASTTTFTPLRQSTSKPRVLDEAFGTPLRRRASERQPLRTTARPTSELDTWARLDRRERERSRPSSQHSIPGSFPVEEASQSTPHEASVNDRQDEGIEDCVSSLIDMGYGSVEDGGRSRMTIYAAASNGNLFDAIEMIEEERKAYAHQGRG